MPVIRPRTIPYVAQAFRPAVIGAAPGRPKGLRYEGKPAHRERRVITPASIVTPARLMA